MNTINPAIQFCLELARFQTELSRRLDARLNGIAFNELIILYHLSQAEEQKMRRIDLATKLGLTPSGITRLLLPMEKIGLISKAVNEHDARVSLVLLAPGGQTKLTEGLERLEIFLEDVIPATQIGAIQKISAQITELRKNLAS